MGQRQTKETVNENVLERKEEDDEPDDWDKRIFTTGCSQEQANMNDCYFEKKDWRACSKEVMAFRECWKRKGNDERTESKDA